MNNERDVRDPCPGQEEEPKEVQEAFEIGPTHIVFFVDEKMSETYPPAPPIHARLRLSKASTIAFTAQETPKSPVETVRDRPTGIKFPISLSVIFSLNRQNPNWILLFQTPPP